MIPVPGVYTIKHQASDAVYVGSSHNIAGRWQAHVGQLRNGSHPNARLQHLWNTSGSEGFEVSLLEPVIPDGARLEAAEKRWHDWLTRAGVRMMSLTPVTRNDAGLQVRLPRLLQHRLNAMLSQRELAEKAGVSPATIVRIEAGKDVHPKTARKLAEALGVRPRELLED